MISTHDFHHRDGRSVRASRFLALIDAITRSRASRPGPTARLHTVGELGLAASDLANKRLDAQAWLYAENRRRRDR